MASKPLTCKAFAITVGGIDDLKIIRSAETRSKARYIEWLAANDAGFDVKFGDVRVVRSPQHDHLCDSPKLISLEVLNAKRNTAS